MIGLQKITVPLREDELTLENITEYLQSVYSAFYLNSQKIWENYNFYKGEHSVLQKKRRYEDDEINNAQVVNQYIWFMVNFKCGYAYGRPLEFARKEPDESPVMPTFNKYLSKIDFAGLTTNLAEWVYAGEEDERGYRIYIPKCVKTECVDGERIKEDTFYKLVDGEFVEVV